MDSPAVTDAELLELARHIASTDYQRLGVRLGVGIAELDEMLRCRRFDYQQCTVSLLARWCGQQPLTDRTVRARLAQALSEVGLKREAELILKVPCFAQRNQNLPMMQGTANVNIPRPLPGLDDASLREIAVGLETDEQMESLALALRIPRADINRAHAGNRASGSMTTRGTADMLRGWRSAVPPEAQLPFMKSAMTSAHLLYLRDTVLARAAKRLEQQAISHQSSTPQQIPQHRMQNFPQNAPQQPQNIPQYSKQPHNIPRYSQQPPQNIPQYSQQESQNIPQYSQPQNIPRYSQQQPQNIPQYSHQSQNIQQHAQQSQNIPRYSPQLTPPHVPHHIHQCSAERFPQHAARTVQQRIPQDTQHAPRHTPHTQHIRVQQHSQYETRRTQHVAEQTPQHIPSAWQEVSQHAMLQPESHSLATAPHTASRSSATSDQVTSLPLPHHQTSHSRSTACCESSETSPYCSNTPTGPAVAHPIEESLTFPVTETMPRPERSSSNSPHRVSCPKSEGILAKGDGVSMPDGSAVGGTSPVSAGPLLGAGAGQPSATSLLPQVADRSGTSPRSLVSTSPADMVSRFSQGLAPSDHVTLLMGNFHISVPDVSTSPRDGAPTPASLAIAPRPTVVPHSVRSQLSVLLNGESLPFGNWPRLADELGLGDYIECLRLPQVRNPTEELFAIAERQKKIRSLKDLAETLAHMGRDDCVDIIEDYRKKQAGSTVGRGGDAPPSSRGDSSEDEL